MLHLQLVGEAAEELIWGIRLLGVDFDEDLGRLGVAIHDAGKVLYPEELNNRGAFHEPAGQTLLLEHGVQPEIARCCLSHARYGVMEVSLEELLVALLDKLWKGKRVETLELQVIDRIAESLGKDRWEVFIPLDCCFEDIAARGDSRLARSTQS